MSGTSSDRKNANRLKQETKLHGADIFLSDMECVRTMPFFGVVPDLEKYADLPELKKAPSHPRDGFMFLVLQKIKNIFL